MKVAETLVIAACVTISTVAGCHRPQSGPVSVSPVVVVTEDGSAFPAVLAGRWKADRHGWEFVVEPDGRISSAVLSFGRVAVLPGRTTTLTTTTGEQATLTAGPWAIHYDPASALLTIKIAMDHVRVPMTPNLLEGSSTDVFTGVLSPSMDAWQAEWTTFTSYKAHTADGATADLSTDKTYGQTVSLVFTKTADR
ncbi:MAG TPA: hypothetical protein VLI39_06295 [Sedimentisphaerales bacterium]|nr:hypothetical protein [Sedimentisphaerales bacterium]